MVPSIRPLGWLYKASLGSGVPYLSAFLLDLFLKGTIIKYKSILFSPWLLQSPVLELLDSSLKGHWGGDSGGGEAEGSLWEPLTGCSSMIPLTA